MISVEAANQILLANTVDFGIEEVGLDSAFGRVLREPIFADRAFPPYDRVTMDGVAIRFEDFKSGTKDFQVVGIAPAGVPRQSISEKNKCLEVMTGSIMPEGFDSVIRYEDLTIKDGVAHINLAEIKFQQNIHFQGEDRKQGEQLLKTGIKISSAEIGVCATVGKSTVKVSKLPKIVILSTGDELVDVDQHPLPHQIRKSNVHRLSANLKSHDISADIDHLTDNYEVITERLKTYLNEYDVILMSGGVSMGKFDFLPKALDELGVIKLFHKIKQRPGKPFWLGRKDDTMVFAFPGNPVSSFMCSHQYFKPWLSGCMQWGSTQREIAVLNEEITFKPDLTYFLVVSLSYSKNGELLATPLPGHGSGDLANLVDGDAFLVLPNSQDVFKKGEVFPVLRYR